MKKEICLMIILLAIPVVFSEDHRYCTLESCEYWTHTLCRYDQPGAVASCGDRVTRGLHVYEKQSILELYNNFNRPLVTLYEQRNYTESGSAVNNSVTVDYLMEWDEELEDIAQRWADQCENHLDKCRNVDRFLVRQRVDKRKTTYSRLGPSATTLASEWYNEDRFTSINNLNFEGLRLQDMVALSSNSYNQLIRRNENRIGCGAVRVFENDEVQYLYLVCNYGTEE